MAFLKALYLPCRFSLIQGFPLESNVFRENIPFADTSKRQRTIVLNRGEVIVPALSVAGARPASQRFLRSDLIVTGTNLVYAGETVNDQFRLDAPIVAHVFFLTENHTDQLATQGLFIVVELVAGVGLLHSGDKALEEGQRLFFVALDGLSTPCPLARIQLATLDKGSGLLTPVSLKLALCNFPLDVQALLCRLVRCLADTGNIAANRQVTAFGGFLYVIPVDVLHLLLSFVIRLNRDVVIFTDGLVYGSEVVLDQRIIEHPQRGFHGVHPIIASAEQVSPILYNGFQNDGEVPFHADLLVQQLADGLKLLAAIAVTLAVPEKVDHHIVWQFLRTHQQGVEVGCHVGELLVSSDLCVAHELACHKVGGIVNDDGLTLGAVDCGINLAVVVGDIGFHVAAERKRFAKHVDNRHLFRVKVPKRSGLSAAGMTIDHY
nr:MAG TPA: hypothetical protein [Caudoviricetes sp.]